MSALERINSRPPTGKVGWPCVLLEGEEKAGKTYAAYKLTGSEKVGRSFVIDLNEGSADEYAPLGRYEVVEHDGTFGDVLAQVVAIRDFAAEELAAGEKPVVLIIDSMSSEWGTLVDAITAKAGRSEKNRGRLREDPAAEIKVPNQLWNDANAKHRRLMTLLLTFPGIVVMTARGKEVAEIRNGAPVEGSKIWKVEGQKNLAYDATCWIRMHRDAPTTLEGARSLHVGVRPGKDAPRRMDSRWEEGGLEWFIFEAYRLDPATAQVRDLKDLTDDGIELPAGVVAMTALEFAQQVVRPIWENADALRRAYSELMVRGLHDELLTTHDGGQVALGPMVKAQIDALTAPPVEESAPPAQEDPQETRQGAPEAPAPAPVGEDAAAPVLEALRAAQTVAEIRAAWGLSGELGVRAVEVEWPQHGRVAIGTLIMRLGDQLTPAGERPADHTERAAGDLEHAG